MLQQQMQHVQPPTQLMLTCTFRSSKVPPNKFSIPDRHGVATLRSGIVLQLHQHIVSHTHCH